MDYKEIFTQVTVYKAEIEKTEAEMQTVSERLVPVYQIAINGLQAKIATALDDEVLVTAMSGLRSELDAEIESIAGLHDRKLIDDDTARSYSEALMTDEHYAPLITYLRFGGKIALVDYVQVIDVPGDDVAVAESIQTEQPTEVSETITPEVTEPIVETVETQNIPVEETIAPYDTTEIVKILSELTLTIKNSSVQITKLIDGKLEESEQPFSRYSEAKPELTALRKKFALNFDKLEKGLAYSPADIWEIVMGEAPVIDKSLFHYVVKRWFKQITDTPDDNSHDLLIYNEITGRGAKYTRNPMVELTIIDDQSADVEKTVDEQQTAVVIHGSADPVVLPENPVEIVTVVECVTVTEQDRAIIDYTLAKAKHLLGLSEEAPERPTFEDAKKFDKEIRSAYAKLMKIVEKNVGAVDADNTEIIFEQLEELKEIIDESTLQEIKRELLRPKKLVAAKKIIETVTDVPAEDVEKPKTESIPKWMPEFKKAIGEAIEKLAEENLLVDTPLRMSSINIKSNSTRMGTLRSIERLVDARILPRSFAKSQRHDIELNANAIVIMFLFSSHQELFTNRTTQKRALEELDKSVNSYLAKQQLAAASKKA